MNPTATSAQFSGIFSQIEYLKTNDADVQFVPSETGSGTKSSIGIQSGLERHYGTWISSRIA